eukprot:CAMPEP_0176365148 /NCGR_PEP_ID=MMETSP0126-20121128/20266_1 /TAXON_ID=141414 ORGANISM="Strombidinopsis acuminatum, Strain SPMC142" /NCGR_SAMPLE_ID=MMETSP0126 /ASSEMBLY_ACC=CAM_ASM_000229 /LENGTH=121 /DNA_ID=CAMNT_0017722031 /DNA_START=1435 /DNA_END=1800 /DNA_ORIENTATION=-
MTKGYIFYKDDFTNVPHDDKFAHFLKDGVDVIMSTSLDVPLANTGALAFLPRAVYDAEKDNVKEDVHPQLNARISFTGFWAEADEDAADWVEAFYAGTYDKKVYRLVADNVDKQMRESHFK